MTEDLNQLWGWLKAKYPNDFVSLSLTKHSPSTTGAEHFTAVISPQVTGEFFIGCEDTAAGAITTAESKIRTPEQIREAKAAKLRKELAALEAAQRKEGV